MTSNAKQIVYGAFAIIGLCATWYFNLQLMGEPGGFSAVDFIRSNYVNAASASIANDVIVVALVFFFWSFNEARKLGMKHWWIYAVLTIVVAIAFAYPLFLLVRERYLSEA